MRVRGGAGLAPPAGQAGGEEGLRTEKGRGRGAGAAVHLPALVAATLAFAGTWLAQRPGYVHGRIETLGLVLGLAAEALLALGGYIGGTLVFAFGVRVVKRPDATLAEALIPGRLAPEASDQPKATEVP